MLNNSFVFSFPIVFLYVTTFTDRKLKLFWLIWHFYWIKFTEKKRLWSQGMTAPCKTLIIVLIMPFLWQIIFCHFLKCTFEIITSVIASKELWNILSGRCVACPWPQRIGAKKDRWWVGGYTQGSSTPPNVTLFHPMTIGSWFLRYIINAHWNEIRYEGVSIHYSIQQEEQSSRCLMVKCLFW